MTSEADTAAVLAPDGQPADVVVVPVVVPVVVVALVVVPVVVVPVVVDAVVGGWATRAIWAEPIAARKPARARNASATIGRRGNDRTAFFAAGKGNMAHSFSEVGAMTFPSRIASFPVRAVR